ncbi:MAG: hypothetical protein KJ077_28905 [Anaerolineae bacterium]|nr:hypothetical protein [Anaerolineae bacterium]
MIESSSPDETVTQNHLDDKPTRFDQFWWQTHNLATLTVFVLLIIACGLATFLFRPLFAPANETSQASLPQINPGAQFIQNSSVLYYVERSPGLKTTDIFARPITTTTPITPQNLTLSPNYSELQPVVAPDGEQLAFFSVSQTGDRSLRVLQPGHISIDVTYHSGASDLASDCQMVLDKPPLWSPDSQWLAFLVECGPETDQMTKLFVASVTGSMVKRISESGYQIAQVSWQDAQTLIYSEQRPDKTEAIYQASTIDPQAQPNLIKLVAAPD